MKAKTLQILWHDRSPVFSADFEQILDGRLATCGGDNNVRIWKVVRINDEPPKMEFLATLSRHTATVNCVRWSPTGGLIASGGDDGSILIWQQCEQRQDSMSEDDNENIQTWRMTSLLRGASSELYDLTWSPDGRFILSACVDNTCRIYNVAENKCVHVMTDHQHFVQGVAWDPLYQFLATQSSDRSVIVYELSLSKAGVLNTNIIARHSKIEPSKLAFKSFISKQDSEVPIDDTALTPSKSHLALSSTGETFSIDSATHKSKAFRIFHDENLTSFFRRLAFSPDGSLLVVPAGLSKYSTRKNGLATDSVLEQTNKASQGTNAANSAHTVYVFGRGKLSSDPILHLAGHKTAPVAIRFNHNRYKLLQSTLDTGVRPTINLPYRYIFAVATQDTVVIYDTQHIRPLAFFGNLHYATFTDMTWSSDGRTLIMSSIDGFCSMVELDENELGVIYTPPAPVEPNIVNSNSDDLKTKPVDNPAVSKPITKMALKSTDSFASKFESDTTMAQISTELPADVTISSSVMVHTQIGLPVVTGAETASKKRRIAPVFLGLSSTKSS
ncbi:Chromatin assembly factor 1 subunit [Batrachochytrium dendrobatidis]